MISTSVPSIRSQCIFRPSRDAGVQHPSELPCPANSPTWRRIERLNSRLFERRPELLYVPVIDAARPVPVPLQCREGAYGYEEVRYSAAIEVVAACAGRTYLLQDERVKRFMRENLNEITQECDEMDAPWRAEIYAFTDLIHRLDKILSACLFLGSPLSLRDLKKLEKELVGRVRSNQRHLQHFHRRSEDSGAVVQAMQQLQSPSQGAPITLPYLCKLDGFRFCAPSLTQVEREVLWDLYGRYLNLYLSNHISFLSKYLVALRTLHADFLTPLVLLVENQGVVSESEEAFNSDGEEGLFVEMEDDEDESAPLRQEGIVPSDESGVIAFKSQDGERGCAE